MVKTKRVCACSILGALLLAGTVSTRVWAGGLASREEGQFKIFEDGKEIGLEKYTLTTSEEAVKSTSVMDFRNPKDPKQRIKIESTLEMDSHYRPKTYRLNTTMDGRKGTISGMFSPNTAMFEYAGEGLPRKSGMLVGDKFTMLDTNVFHHFIFIARLFDIEKVDEEQKFEVVVPQEGESGIMKIKHLGTESIEIKGKKISAHHLRGDSGQVLIDLWVDAEHILHKIAVPSMRIEVLRS